VLVQAAGLSPAVWTTAAVFAAAVVGHAFLRIPGTERSGASAADVSVRDGLRFTWRCRPIRDLCLQSGLFDFHEQAFLLGPVLARGSTAAPVLGAAFVANGIALAAYNVLAVSLRQAIPPREFLAAATASYRMISFGTIPPSPP
jgi:hypothetical protein